MLWTIKEIPHGISENRFTVVFSGCMVKRMAPSEIPDDFIERPLDVADMPRFRFREDIGGRVASSLVYILVLALYIGSVITA